MLLYTFDAQFKFNNQIYDQKDRVEMGFPLVPLPAKVSMSKLDRGPLDSSIQTFYLCKHYVDDIFGVLSPRRKLTVEFGLGIN